MKYLLKITIIISLIFSMKSFAQLDTLNYVKQFEVNKANYIGQPFSKLLNEMTQIQPTTQFSYSPFNDKNNRNRTVFNFCNPNFEFNRNIINMMIFWDSSIPKSDIIYYDQLHNFNFTNDERQFYGSKIVKDIMVYR